ADANQTPVWLIVIHVYNRDLVRFRKRGKKLADVLLEKISFLTATNEEVLLPLISRLKDFVRKFALTRPICFLAPDRWLQTRETLRYCLQPESPAEHSLLSHLEKINGRTLGPSRLLHASKVPNRQKLIELLDSAKAS